MLRRGRMVCMRQVYARSLLCSGAIASLIWASFGQVEPRAKAAEGGKAWWQAVRKAAHYEEWPTPRREEGLVRSVDPSKWSAALGTEFRQVKVGRPWRTTWPVGDRVVKAEMDVELFSTVEEARERMLGAYASYGDPGKVSYEHAPVGEVSIPLPEKARLEAAFCRLNVFANLSASVYDANRAIRSAEEMPEVARRLSDLARKVDQLIQNQDRVMSPEMVWVPRLQGLRTIPAVPAPGEPFYLDADAVSIRPGFDPETVTLYSVDSVSGPKFRAVKWPKGPRLVMVADSAGTAELRVVCVDGVAYSPAVRSSVTIRE
jgi:hypothetical protein